MTVKKSIWIIVLIIVVISIIGVVIVILVKRKKNKDLDSATSNLVASTKTTTGSGTNTTATEKDPPVKLRYLTASEVLKCRNIAQAIHDDLKGISWGRHNITPYNQMLNLDDSLFTGVYNQFNLLYESENSGTLFEWISSDSGFFGSWRDTASKILDRMVLLGLK